MIIFINFSWIMQKHSLPIHWINFCLFSFYQIFSFFEYFWITKYWNENNNKFTVSSNFNLKDYESVETISSLLSETLIEYHTMIYNYTIKLWVIFAIIYTCIAIYHYKKSETLSFHSLLPINCIDTLSIIPFIILYLW